MDIQELINKAISTGEDITGTLKQKSIIVRPWWELKKEFDPKEHEVMNKGTYPDITVYEEKESETERDDFGNPKIVKVPKGVEKVSRITYATEQLAVKRTTELCFGIPVKRVYKAENDRQQEISTYIENILARNHIDTVNIERGRKLFASCEAMTLWYSVEEENNIYGFKSKLKLRCVTYSPMQGDDLYPLFDEKGDLIALSVGYERMVKDKRISYFDVYTAQKHLRWSNEKDGTSAKSLDVNEDIAIQKIPAVYIYRPEPIWENTSVLRNEMEWASSRNGNYIRKNSRPILGVFADESIQFNKSPLLASRDVEQLPAGADLRYITWNQSIESIKFFTEETRRTIFTQLQLPDISFENMKTIALSGEAMKRLFIDCHLKVTDESGRWLEFFDREISVIKAYLKQMLTGYDADIDALKVTNVITPYTITSDADNVNLYVSATAGKPVMSQSTAIEKLGMVDDAQEELAKIQAESMLDVMEPTM